MWLEHVAEREAEAADDADEKKITAIGTPDVLGTAAPFGSEGFAHRFLRDLDG